MPPDPDDLRVLVVADDPLARAGLVSLLESQPGCAVVGQMAGSPPPDWAAAMSAFNPDVVLWDLGWDAALPGLESLGEPDGGPLSPPVVALLPDDALALDVWAAGARGILARDAPGERLAAALHAAAQGLVSLDAAVAGALLPAEGGSDAPPAEALTARELEVLQLLAEGLSNKAIGVRLDISEHTVKFHVNAIMGKLGAQSRTEAVVRATRLGLIIL